MLEWLVLGAAIMVAIWAASGGDPGEENRKEEDKVVLEMEDGSIKEFYI